MDQIDRLVFDVTGRDRGGSKVLDDASRKADAAHQSMSKLGSTLSGLGGPFEQVTNLASQLGAALEGQAGKAQKAGLALTAVGVGLIGVAAKDAQAQRQLQQAIDNTGQSYSDYRGQIEDAIRQQERNAHTADDTENALNTLTTATQDTTRSLGEMNFVADIAAEKHESLAEAAIQLVQAQAGNTRAFKSFGIVLDTTLPKSVAVDKALKQLQDRLSGQAPASVDTFVGHLKVMETHLHDEVALFGEKYGPAVTIAGAALTATASIAQLVVQRKIAESLATANETRAELANAAARERTTAVATAQAAAIQRVTIAQSEGTAIGAAMAGGLGGGLRTGAILGRVGRAGGYAIGGQIAGSIVGGRAGSVIGDAGIGAGIGSLILPGVGTAVGAVAGGLIGAFGSGSHGPSPQQQAQQAALASTERGYQQLTDKLAKFRQIAQTTSGPVHDLAEKEIQSTKAALAAGKASHDYATSLIAQEAAAKGASLSLNGQLKALEASASKAIGLSSAEDDLRAAMHNMAQAVHDGTGALKGHTQAAQDNRAALRDSVSKMLGLIQAERDAGVSGEKVRASAVAMARALERNATQIYGNKTAVDQLLHSFGVMPGQMDRALTSLRGVFSDMNDFFSRIAANAFNWGESAGTNFNAGWDVSQGRGAGSNSPFLDPGHPGYQDTKAHAKNYGKSIADDVVSGYAPAVDTGLSDATKKAEEKAKRMLDLERQTAQQVAQAFKSARDQIVGGFNVTELPQKTDLFGTSYTAGTAAHAARQFVHQLEEWANLLGHLRRKGLNEVMLDQFEQAGVAAIPAMREVLKNFEVGDLNRAERHIRRIGRQVASSQIADTEAQHLEHVLQRLPHRLAHELAKELKHLDINIGLKEFSHHRGHRVRNKS